MTHFFIFIKDPISDSILGWCKPEDLENLRRAYPYLTMQPFPAQFSEDEMNASLLYCGPEACGHSPALVNMLKLHDDLMREKREAASVSLEISKRLLRGMEKRVQEEKTKREGKSE